MRAKKEPGTHREEEARNGLEAGSSLARAVRQREALSRNFRAGLLLGLSIGFAVLALTIWLWAVPAVEGANRQAAQAVAEAYGRVEA